MCVIPVRVGECIEIPLSFITAEADDVLEDIAGFIVTGVGAMLAAEKCFASPEEKCPDIIDEDWPDVPPDKRPDVSLDDETPDVPPDIIPDVSLDE